MSHTDDAPRRPAPPCTGILLAAGRGTRFDAQDDKLVQPCGAHGEMVAVCPARSLLAVMPVVAVVAAAGALQDALQALGCQTILLDASAPRAMSATLRRGIAHAVDARAWLVALADMPLVQPATIARVAAALHAGAHIAVPVHGARRGHPVGFSAHHRDALLALQGDTGARAILAAHAVTEVPVDDPGIFADVDTRADLQAVTRLK